MSLHQTKRQHVTYQPSTHVHRQTQAIPSTSKPEQLVAPLFVQPDGQLPHVLLPAVFVQLRLLSQPPLFEAHSLISK